MCIIGFNSPEWYLADLGAVFANGLAVGIYPTNSPDACKYILKDCEANIVVVEDEKQLAKVLEVRGDCPALKAIVQYTGQPKEDGVIGWEELLKIGAAEDDAELGRGSQSGRNLRSLSVRWYGFVGPSRVQLAWSQHCLFNCTVFKTKLLLKPISSRSFYLHTYVF